MCLFSPNTHIKAKLSWFFYFRLSQIKKRIKSQHIGLLSVVLLILKELLWSKGAFVNYVTLRPGLRVSTRRPQALCSICSAHKLKSQELKSTFLNQTEVDLVEKYSARAEFGTRAVLCSPLPALCLVCHGHTLEIRLLHELLYSLENAFI